MFKKFLALNQKNKFVEENDRILLGFSAGPDSTFLFYMLIEMKKYLNFDFAICYIDHSMRRKEVEKEKGYARFLSDKYGVKLYIRKIILKDRSNIEENLREKRYLVFKNLSRRYGYNKIFTAHNKDEQIETFFLRLIRGAGTKGLSGIPERRKISPEIEVVRPILNFWKIDIISYLKKKNIKFFIDSSNYSENFLRNRIRKRVIPVFKRYFGTQILENIFKFQEIFKYENDYLDYCVNRIKDKVFSYDRGKLYIARDKFLKYNKSLRKIILHRVFEGKYKLVNILDMLNLIEGRKNYGKVMLPFNTEILRSSDKLVVRKIHLKKRKNIFRLKAGEKRYFKDFGISIYIKEVKDLKDVDFSMSPERKIYLDGTCIKNMFLRGRIPGDKIFIEGVGSKKIKNIFIDLKIPVWERENVALFGVDNKIVWIVGYKRSGDFLINKDTKKILEVGVE